MAKVATMSASIISRLGEDTCFSTAGSNQENAKIPAVVHLQAFGTYDSLPVLDLQPAIDQAAGCTSTPASTAAVHALAEGVAESLRRTGCCIVRDPRVQEADNDRFLDMMECYFSQPWETKLKDTRPQLHYQVGATPAGVEVPRAAHDATSQERIRQQPPEHRATTPVGADPKWRFMWRLGPRPAQTQFAELNAEPVIPAAFPDWSDVMDTWGGKMLASAHTVSQLAAVGLGLEPTAFAELLAHGPHLLAPTGTDLEQHGQKGCSTAGYHYDLNFLTLHGKSRFPGLFVWLRDGRRVAVGVPPGCLFLQAGRQMEWLTGGAIVGGMHEVVVSDSTLAAMDAARAAGRPLWRVSSTVFAHVASDQILRPLGVFASPETEQLYPPTLAGQFVQAELEAIRLKAN